MLVMLGSISLQVLMKLLGKLKFSKDVSSKHSRGMGSIAAMKKVQVDRYFQGSVNEANKLVPEGIEGRSIRGCCSDIVFQAADLCRMGYVGAANLQELMKMLNLLK